MSLTRAVIGILSQYDDAGLIKWRGVQRIEDVVASRENDFPLLFFTQQKFAQ